MANGLKIFFWGIGISFAGTLPLGTLNITAMQIAISKSIVQAIWFSLGCVLVEMLALYATLVGAQWLLRQRRLLALMEWFTFFIMLLLALYSFLAATKAANYQNTPFSQHIPAFFLGVLLSAINPAQFPFWFGWNSFLLQKQVLHNSRLYYGYYISGAASGTLLGFLVFIVFGQWLAAQLVLTQQIINTTVGVVFLLTALLQAYKMWRKKTSENKTSSG
jgi:threonine/homoserine/homoserine lactone efflux protein